MQEFPSTTSASMKESSGFPTYSKEPTQDDLEQQEIDSSSVTKTSVYAGLGWLDRLLVLWILLAIIIGIVLGNFVNGIEQTLQKGKFVNVSVPIGRCSAGFLSS